MYLRDVQCRDFFDREKGGEYWLLSFLKNSEFRKEHRLFYAEFGAVLRDSVEFRVTPAKLLEILTKYCNSIPLMQFDDIALNFFK